VTILRIQKRHKEKRGYARMSINAAMKFSIEGKKNNVDGLCEDLSHTGIRFTTSQALKKGESVYVELDTKNVKFKPLKAAVEILRVEAADDRYRVAGIIRDYK
jgi:hypothetical protein